MIVTEFYQLQKREKACFELKTNLETENSIIKQLLEDHQKEVILVKSENKALKQRIENNQKTVDDSVTKVKNKNIWITGLVISSVVEGIVLYFQFKKNP